MTDRILIGWRCTYENMKPEKHPDTDRILIGWRCTYETGIQFDSSFMRWRDLPRHGVQVLEKFYQKRISENDVRNWREIMNGHDCYCPMNPFTDENETNLSDWVKWGTYIDDKSFHALCDFVMNDRSRVTEMLI